jgi:hypothetical protein
LLFARHTYPQRVAFGFRNYSQAAFCHELSLAQSGMESYPCGN